MTLDEALHLAKVKEGYSRCRNPEHGLGSTISYEGKTGPAKFAICPNIQFAPRPTYLFLSYRDFIKFAEKYYV